MLVMLTNLLSLFVLNSEALAEFDIPNGNKTYGVAASSFQSAQDIL